MKKNIIYIHTHDSGKVLSPYGYNVPTQSLQAFTKDATIFREAYCVGPTCSPSRSGLLTGMYPHSNGMYGLSQRGFKLHDYNQHLVNFLKENHYHTVLAGIQHEAGSYIDHEQGAKIIGYDQDISADNAGMPEEELVKWDYDNAFKVKSWLENYREDKPFFLSYGLFSTHRKFPEKGHDNQEEINANYIMPPDPLAKERTIREDYAGYLKSASWFDESFKVVMNAIKENGFYEQSIIIFTTDHGIAFPFSKCNLFDTGIGVSLIMRVPDSQMHGKEIDGLISQVDVFPTLCDLIGIRKPDYLQGESFAEMFEQQDTSGREEIFSEINYHTSYEPARSVRTKRYKYIKFYDRDYLKINRTNIDNSISKVFYQEHGLEKAQKPEEALYDLYYDPSETNNVIEHPDYHDVVIAMREKLLEHQTKTNDPILTGHFQVQEGWKINKKEHYNPSSKDPDDFLKIGE
ncbi:sulfatase [Amphibacillus cookii]|uniref:sulfatase family protein n=1 Tax=Amphibacillus cookii TaxID=767787 RepID=UPI001958E620|nr:sulfatase [Amphibacillus cookii]MBM7542035.1 arylsulfatase A-like enzyme [Amphibacillus cookii]